MPDGKSEKWHSLPISTWARSPIPAFSLKFPRCTAQTGRRAGRADRIGEACGNAALWSNFAQAVKMPRPT